jgi:hypothetical protein
MRLFDACTRALVDDGWQEDVAVWIVMIEDNWYAALGAMHAGNAFDICDLPVNGGQPVPWSEPWIPDTGA